MSLDFTLTESLPTEVASHNITHNLTPMAKAAGVYDCLWRPYESGYTYARDIIEKLEAGLADLKVCPEHFKAFDAPNGWGLYKNFVSFVEDVLKSAKEYPNAVISTRV